MLVSLFAASFALAVVGVSATIDPRVPILPLNSQIGAAKFGFQCNIPILGLQAFPGFVGGTAPSAIQPSQPYSLTDASAQVNVSNFYSFLAGFVGVTSANVTVSSVILYDYSGNQSPSEINALKEPLIINNIPVTPGKDIIVRVPLPPKTITTPPFTIKGNTGETAVVAYGGVNLTITLVTANNTVFLFPLPISCIRPTVPLIVSTLNIRGSPNTTLNDIQNGVQDSFPDVPINFQVGSFRYPVSCSISSLGSYKLDISISGALPVNIPEGQKFSVVNATGAIRISKSVISAIKAKYSGATKITGSITEFELRSSNTDEGVVNVAATPIPINTPVPLSGQSQLDGGQLIVVPQDPTQTITGTLTASANTAGKLASVAIGKAAGSINILSSSGATLGQVTISCADPQIALVVVPIVAPSNSTGPFGF